MQKIKDIPKEDRPREKLLEKGAQALSHAELLALFINTGKRGENALQMAERLLREQGGVKGLGGMGAMDLSQLHGLGPAKAALIAAAFEIGKRAERAELLELPLNNPEVIYRFMRGELQMKQVEEVYLLLVNIRLKLVRVTKVSQGTINESLVGPREVMAEVLRSGAYGFILVHNHPSGDPSPSRADHEITKRLEQCAKLMGVTFVDHVICGIASAESKGYFSFMEKGELGKS
jgi:DNA repair protein RadC